MFGRPRLPRRQDVRVLRAEVTHVNVLVIGLRKRLEAVERKLNGEP